MVVMASVSVCSAAEIKKTIQVSATIAPYCVIGRGYEGQENNVSRHVVKQEGNVTVLYY